jgi:DNA polymerase III subunit gamma/tau
VVTALYRRYRPETFAELIGQSQVTDPLRTALRTDRVNHAYLFSGPRGCGKTTSARILARCLNCVEGPTDTPCGVCPSCVELSRDGSGSLDVVEIDAASHNGVDDARDLRERAVFAPARDRFKIFILDEAHMVTPQGFNALLKIVEEPPEHVKFIFATTEPEKVIGTIRSRTHHYPFRLVPPAQMLEYVQSLCEQEKVTVEAGVLPLVVRAGGGSVRDTLSLLDQLIAGSEGTSVLYERAVALLGYTHGALLDDVVDAMGAGDAGGVFGAVDRVIQTGQDPRRFVEDLLERLRDLIIVAATADRASAVMRGMPQDQLDRMSAQAAVFGEAELSRAADVVNAALTEMTGATSPRLHLELMVARILVPASDDSERGALARVERLERRINVAGPVTAGPTAVTPATAAPASPAARESAAAMAAATPSAAQPAAEPAPAEPAPAAQPAAEPAAAEQPVAEQPPIEPTPSGEPAALAEPGSVSLQQIRDAWPEILDIVRDAKMSAWVVLETAQARDLRDGDILTVSFPSDNDVANFKQSGPGATGVSEFLRTAILQVLGLRVKFIAKSDVVREQAPEAQAPPADDGWAVTAIPGAEPAQAPRAAVVKEPVKDDGPERYGESVVREMLGASFIEEQPLRPRVVPTAQGE